MSEQEAQRLAAVVGDHLEGQGYRVVQELTGDPQRVDLLGTRGGEWTMVEIQLGPEPISEERARLILGGLKQTRPKFGAGEASLALAPGVVHDDVARAVFRRAGMRLLSVDPKAKKVAEL
jgi:hypothetical protein